MRVVSRDRSVKGKGADGKDAGRDETKEKNIGLDHP